MDPIITSAITSFVTTVATNSSKVPMQSLDDLWYLAFGKINHLAEKKKARHEIALTKYKNSIAEKVLSIEESNLQEPSMSVVGPALEASRYYIEEKELREMFANVIAASMDKSKNDNVHHSFVEIIKQLSPIDANNIKLFQVKGDYPIVQFKTVDLKNNSYGIVKTNVFKGDFSDIISGDENAASITNLHRLGLLTISYEENYTDNQRYCFFRNSSLFIGLEQHINPQLTKIDIGEGIIRITPLGKAFINVCL